MERDCLDWAYFTDGLAGRLEGDLGGENDMYQVPVEYKELNIRTR